MNEKPERTIVLRGAICELWPKSSRVTLPDGSQITSASEDTDNYRATARNYGYGDDIDRMAIEHDVLHAWVAQLLCHPEKRPESPILFAVAHDTFKELPLWQVAGEEALVGALTRWINLHEYTPELAAFVLAGEDLHAMYVHAQTLFGKNP